jgi:hypothetical protein
MAVVLRIGIYTFRTLNGPLSGELRVKGGSSRGRGARGLPGPAKKKEPGFCAGSDDGDGPTYGESAHTSAAHAAGPEPCADLAGISGSETKRAPKEGESGEGEAAGPTEKKVKRGLPRDAFEFANQVNEERQLVDVAAGMLGRSDDRVKQKVLQQLLSMAYPKSTKPKVEKVRTYINDLATAIRD